MGIGISGGGSLGLAFETNVGVYASPTKYHPILSESLEFMPGLMYRRPIRQSIDQIGVVPGNVSVSGTVSAEALDDILVYYLYAMRMQIVRTGTSPNWVYTCTPTSLSVFPTRTLSLTVVRNSQTFGYTGCVVSKLTLGIQNDILQADMDIIGLNEAIQNQPSPTWNTTVPIGPGQWNVQVPTGTQIFDMDTFSFSIDEAGTANYRLKNTGANAGRGAQFIGFGERTVQMTASRDFIDRTDYNAFLATLPQSITILGTANSSVYNSIQFLIGNATKSAMQIVMGAQGDIVRSTLTYDTVIDGNGNACQLAVNTQETIS
jgi:Phage tail tube protein